MIIDITRTLGQDDIAYPGDPVFAREEFIAKSVDDESAAAYTAARLTMSSHSGTHLDAPRHLFADGLTLDQYPPERFILTARVISCEEPHFVGTACLAGLDLPAGEAVLFRTVNSLLPRDGSGDYVSITPQAARALVKSGVALVGIDHLSVDAADAAALPVHRILLKAGVLILEDVNLGAVSPGRYRLTCLPLKIRNADAAPCRAVLEGPTRA